MRKVIVPSNGVHYLNIVKNNPKFIILNLYGKSEDRRGEEDLVPSEELTKEAQMHRLPDGSGFFTGVVGTDKQDLCDCGHIREDHDGAGCFADPETCQCERQPGMFDGESDDITKSGKKPKVRKTKSDYVGPSTSQVGGIGGVAADTTPSDKESGIANPDWPIDDNINTDPDETRESRDIPRRPDRENILYR
jgi:hypothetical protein